MLVLQEPAMYKASCTAAYKAKHSKHVALLLPILCSQFLLLGIPHHFVLEPDIPQQTPFRFSTAFIDIKLLSSKYYILVPWHASLAMLLSSTLSTLSHACVCLCTSLCLNCNTLMLQAEGQCRAGQLLGALGLDISLPGIRAATPAAAKNVLMVLLSKLADTAPPLSESRYSLLCLLLICLCHSGSWSCSLTCG